MTKHMKHGRSCDAPSCDIFNLGFIIFQCPLTTVHHLYIDTLCRVIAGDCGRSVDSGDHKSPAGGGGGGSFSSPNYPDHYPSDVVCHYTFHAHDRQRVQLAFTDFRLRHDPGVPTHTLARRLARPWAGNEMGGVFL